jgi:hypothetical protein
MDAGNVVALLTAMAGLIAASVGVLNYFNYRTKKARIATVGTAFEAVVEALASTNDVRRMAAAIRLRRFFDARAELATGGVATWLRRVRRGSSRRNPPRGGHPADADRSLTSDELPYAADAINVIVAILRTVPPGDFQKLLADALTHAPKALLIRVDLQRANLQNAWLGEIDLPAADFYRADLSNASFKDGGVERAQFYEARLARTRFTRSRLANANFFGADLTRADFGSANLHEASFVQSMARRASFRDALLERAVFTSADLRDADFRGADLAGVAFDGARLDGAAFDGACHIPEAVSRRLGDKGVVIADERATKSQRRVFLSQPAVLAPQQQALADRVSHVIEAGGAEVVRLGRRDYPASGSCAEIRRLMGGCTAAAIIGVPQLSIEVGTYRPGTSEEAEVRDTVLATPWNHVEAGIAIAMDLPILVVRNVGDAGIFEVGADVSTVTTVTVDDCGPLPTVDDAIAQWLRTLTSF